MNVRWIGSVLVIIAAVLLAPVAVSAGSAAFAIPGARIAIDPAGTATLAQARALTYVDTSEFRYPGTASAMHPLIVWLRFSLSSEGDALVAAPAVGYGDVYYVPPGARTYEAQRFGMRVPYAQRSVSRTIPTLVVPPHDARQAMYLRLALDDESRVVSMISVMDARSLREQDYAMDRLASTSLLFIGMFISLAAANILVFAFVRERAYIVYSAMMLSNALFAATYMHESAWQWLWPMLSLADPPVQAYCIILEAIALLAFARTFLDTPRIVPKFDRAVLGVCVLAIILALGVAQLFPSARIFGGNVTGRDIFILLTLFYIAAVFALGVAALRAGSQAARFFVVSNGSVSLIAAVAAAANFMRHDVTIGANFISLMLAQAVEGWILFGALAYRLRTVLNAHTEEQQRRLVAQAEALTQARALLETRQLAATDSLTGIANRRAFEEALAREWEHSVRAGTPIAMIMLDIDYFKRYNDAYGHQSGDECLGRVAATVASIARRPADIAARYGGEEFAVILSDTDEAAALGIAYELLEAVRASRITHRESPSGFVTVSIGVAGLRPNRFDGREQLVAQADEQLYCAKNAGRDRISAASLPRSPVN